MDKNRKMNLRVYKDVMELAAGRENPTPMVGLSRLMPDSSLTLWAKLEWYSPSGSVKDRAALSMIRRAMERDELNGRTLVEPTSGNMGIALQLYANALGLPPVTITVPEMVPEEKVLLLRLLGAEVVEVPDGACPRMPTDGAIATARALVESQATTDQYHMLYQYGNPDNPLAHYENTGPEIVAQTEGQVTHLIAGLGTGGTLMGLARYFHECHPAVKVIAVEPAEADHSLFGMRNLEVAMKPEIYDPSLVDEVIKVSDRDAYRTAIRLMREEGLLAGPSAGANTYAATQLAQRGEVGTAVIIFPDNVFKYVHNFRQYMDQEVCL
ncbi:MAG: PLP-dependent cysteine synthase family protein [Anaerolineae bacterium]